VGRTILIPVACKRVSYHPKHTKGNKKTMNDHVCSRENSAGEIGAKKTQVPEGVRKKGGQRSKEGGLIPDMSSRAQNGLLSLRAQVGIIVSAR